jgi:hypothetical protein
MPDAGPSAFGILDIRMTPAVWFRRFAWLACAVLLAGTVEASPRTLTADFDGDGHSDSVTIDTADPFVLHITLSRTGTRTRIQRARAVLEIAARDVDGDHLPELITTEAGAASALKQAGALRVWKTDARHGFKRIHPRHRGPGTLKAPSGRSLDNDDPADEANEDFSSVLQSRESLNTRDVVAQDTDSSSCIPLPHPDAALASVLPRDLSTPRAPPLPARLISLLA